MGLNGGDPRPRRESIDPPNDFITHAMGETDMKFSHYNYEVVADFENEILDGVLDRYRNIRFDR